MELNEIPDTVSGWLWIHFLGANVADKGPLSLSAKVSKILRRFPSISLMRRRTGVSIPAEDKERTSFLELRGSNLLPRHIYNEII